MKTYSIPDNLQELLANWSALNEQHWPEAVIDQVARALDVYQHTMADHDEPVQEIGLSAADILVKLRMDHESVIAALMLACVDNAGSTVETLCQDFDDNQQLFLENVLSFEQFGSLYKERSNDSARLEDLRKLFMSMAQDIRSVIVKIAYSLAQLRSAKHFPPEQEQQLAQEVMDIYAPLANRLGIGQVKWEMEDLAFKRLDPATYKKIASALAEKREEREQFIEIVTERVQIALDEAKVPGIVYGRAKHIYSIWRKMHQKKLSFNDLYDVRAVRITTDTIDNCYRIMTVIHSLWRDIPTEFDDYISNPKPNGYQSLHTAVIGPFSRTLEVQIRTEAMHEFAERGVAAHWRYKEGSKADKNLEQQIEWLREILEHKDQTMTSEDLVELFKTEIAHERLYVVTPKGDLVNLPKPSTPLDFAYYVHTDIGHRCRGAKVNGRIVPLTRLLESGDRVEVLTAKQGDPSRDWLQPYLGYLRTARARSKVRAWFREQNKQTAVATGKSELEAAFKRLGLSFAAVQWENIAKSLNYRSSTGLYAGFGNDEIGFNRILSALPKSITNAITDDQSSTLETELKIRPNQLNSGEAINVQGVGNLMVQMAKCCNPVPPDMIVGFITLNRGINVHRQDCSNLLNMETFHKERFINISWQNDQQQHYVVAIQVVAVDRSKLFHEISTLLSIEDIDIVSFNTDRQGSDQIIRLNIEVEIADLFELNRIMDKIDQLSGVLSVYRKTR